MNVVALALALALIALDTGLVVWFYLRKKRKGVRR